LRREGATAGYHLREQWLGDQLGISRTPVRTALQLLETRGVLVARRNQGYFLLTSLDTIEDLVLEPPPTADQDLYTRLVRDRLAGRIANEFTQKDLARHYNADRLVMQQTLRRMSDDGLLHSNGARLWSFAPALDSGAALEDSFQFRRMFEPQAILLPGFRVDPDALDQTMRQHRHIETHPEIDAIPPRLLFDADSRFHEMVAEFSCNTFVIQTMRQQSRLRRLLEFGGYTNRARVHLWCSEHIAIMAALGDHDLPRASYLMTVHLDRALAAAHALIEIPAVTEKN
jgi:DNA-binding GntR family transcriptional regulator